MSQIPRWNGWTIAEQGGDRAPDKTQRPLSRAPSDETSQVKQGHRTAGVKRHYLGRTGKVANGITTVHLADIHEGTGRALIAARQWIPREHIEDPACRKVMKLPPDPTFRTKGPAGRGPVGVAIPAYPCRPVPLGRLKDSQSGKGCFGLDRSQVRLYTEIRS